MFCYAFYNCAFIAKYRKLSHTVYHSNFHVVFVPKYPNRILEGKVKDLLFTLVKIAALQVAQN